MTTEGGGLQWGLEVPPTRRCSTCGLRACDHPQITRPGLRPARVQGVVVALWTDSSPRTHAVRNVTGAGWASPPSAGGPADQFTLMTQLSAGGVDSDTAVGETQLGETVALPLVSPVMTPTKSPGM